MKIIYPLFCCFSLFGMDNLQTIDVSKTPQIRTKDTTLIKFGSDMYEVERKAVSASSLAINVEEDYIPMTRSNVILDIDLALKHSRTVQELNKIQANLEDHKIQLEIHKKKLKVAIVTAISTSITAATALSVYFSTKC
jgi:hypothetical protein